MVNCPHGLKGAFAIATPELWYVLAAIFLIGVFLGVLLSWRS